MDTEILEAPEVVEEAPSLRETIEEAVDEASGQDAAGESTPGVGRPAGPETGVPETKPSPDQQPSGAKPAIDPATAPVAPNQPAPTELKAPSQWKAAVREKWAQLPREVQEEVLRREGDNLRLIGSVGSKIRLADEVGNHIQPFVERLQQNGANTSEFLGDVFTTVKTLAGGTPQDKAEVIANIVQSYKVDVRLLDNVLSGRLSAPPPDPRVVEAQRRAFAAESVLARQQQTVVQHQQKAASQTMQQFASDPKNEFFEDVREMMADLLETGRATTLDDAYVASVWANPDTRKILLQRESEARVVAKRNRAGAARRASLSVAGAPRGPGGTPSLGDKLSLRDTIAAAIDAQDAA
jgi:hypothetical protein